MTDFGRRAGIGNMLKAVYDPNEDGVIAIAQTQADMMKAAYDPNDDGVIAVAQTQADMVKAVYDPVLAAIQALAAAHKTQHQNGGTDEINATGLVGVPVAPLLLDAVAGRVLRMIYFKIHNGTTDVSLKCELLNQWNGDSDGPTDNIVHGAQTGNYDLSANGQVLIAVAAAFTANVVAAWGYIITNSSGTHLHGSISVSGGGIAVILNAQGTGGSQTQTALVDIGTVELSITYITDA